MRALIAHDPYDVAWTRLDHRFFNQTASNETDFQQAISNFVPDHDLTNEYDWVSNGQLLPITLGTPTQQPLLLADNYRNLILVQNNSSAVAPDTAPNLFMSINGPVTFSTQLVGTPVPAPVSFSVNAITFAPGVGLLLDERIFANAIYFAWGAFANSGNTVLVNGICAYGRTPNSPPLPPQLQLATNPSFGYFGSAGGASAGPAASR